MLRRLPGVGIFRTLYYIPAVVSQVAVSMVWIWILLLGIAYKKNISDMRESPAVRLMELLREQGAVVDYHDPHVPVIPKMRKHPDLVGIASVPVESIAGAGYDAILIATDHDAVDYAHLIETGLPIIDTRNVIARRGLPMANVYKA